MLTRRLLPILALFATLLAAPAAVAAPPDVECPPGQTDCQIIDEEPGGGGNNGGGNNGGGSSGGGSEKCFRTAPTTMLSISGPDTRAMLPALAA